MSQSMPQTTTYDVFMDGSCSFCQWTQAKIEPYDSGSRLRFLDYNDPAVAAQAGALFRRPRLVVAGRRRAVTAP